MVLHSRFFLRMSEDRGMVVVFVAIMLPVIIGLMAVSLDGGLLYLQRRHAQSTADAAALAGAFALYNGSNFSTAQSAAIAIGSQNGITITKAQITEPQTNYVAVTVTSSRPRSFSAIWGAGSLSVTASSVARTTSSTYSSTAMIVLDKTAVDSLYLTGNSTLTVTGGGVQVNSNAPIVPYTSGAFAVTNMGSVSAPAIAVVGGSYFQPYGTGPISPSSPSQGSVVNDPLANASPPIAPPSLAAAQALGTYANFSTNNGSTVTMSPGYYPNGVNIGYSTVTMSPGTYYLAGGNFFVSNNATLSGSGVTIYLSSTAVTNNGISPVTNAAVNIQSAFSVTLTPPTSGAYTGMLFYVDPGNSAAVQFASNITNVSMSGTIYAPSSLVDITGYSSSTLPIASQIIADTVRVDNNTKALVNWTASSVASNTTMALVQ